MTIDGVNNNSEALKMYEMYKSIPFGSEMLAVAALTKESENIRDNYDQVLEDQNEYLIDIEDTEDEVKDKVYDLDLEIEKLKQEIEEMLSEKPFFLMNAEERAEFDAKNDRLNELTGYRERAMDVATGKIDKKQDDYTKIEDKAKDFGSTLVEKAEPLANTEIKDDWWHEFWGATGQNKKDVGERGVEVGNSLLDKVAESANLTTEIEEKKDIEI